MLNLNELESRWLKYKIKSYIPHAIILVSLLILSSIASVVFLKNEEKQPKKTEIKIRDIIKPIALKKEPIIKQEVIKEIIVEKESSSTKMTIDPSLDFMRTMQEHSPKYYNDVVPKPYKAPKRTFKKAPKKIQKKVIIVEEPRVEVVKENLIAIKRKNTQQDIQHVVARFKKSNNPALSLFIAKKYYELGKYNQSYNYALLTNEINSDIEESWIIFAKSLVKLKKSDKAIKILQEYIEVSHSSRASILLNKIKSGKMQ